MYLTPETRRDPSDAYGMHFCPPGKSRILRENGPARGQRRMKNGGIGVGIADADS
jgi:hypothetical protein